MLRAITPERHRIAEVMIFSIEHTESTDEICQTIRESLTNPKTALPKKMARLYILSDILHNCCARGMNAVYYRKCKFSLLDVKFQYNSGIFFV
jgi:U2-associated protein SR140